MAGAQPLGLLAAPHLRAPRVRDPALLAPASGTAVGAVRCICTGCPPTSPSRTAPLRWAGIGTSPTPASGCATGSRHAAPAWTAIAPRGQTAWPGEEPAEPVEDVVITHRDEDFVQFMLDDVAARRQTEDDFYENFHPGTGELT